MKKGIIWIMSLFLLLTMSMALGALTIRTPQASEIITGTKIFNTTTDWAAQNCSFYRGTTAATATTLIGTVYNATDFGATNTVFNLTIVAATISDGVYAVNVTCYNESLDAANVAFNKTGVTGVIVDNTVPVVSVSLSAATVHKRQGNTATCSALGGFTTITNYSQNVLYPDGSSAGTSTSSIYNMDGAEFDQIGTYSITCAATEQTNLTTRSATEYITVNSQSSGLSTLPAVQQAQTIQAQAMYGEGIVGWVNMNKGMVIAILVIGGLLYFANKKK